MGFLRKKDRPYEVPEEVAGARSEIDDFRARLRQQVGGEEAKVNPELAKLKEQYDSRFTEDIVDKVGEGGSDDRDPREKEIESLLGGGDFNPYVSKSSFASPDDTTPSAEVPGLESRARPPTKSTAGGSQAPGSGEFQCEDCATSYKERWSTCPKCGGKVDKRGVDPEVARLQAQAEQGPGGVRQVDPGTSLSGLDSGLHSEFGRDEAGGLKPADDLLADLTDLSPGGAEAPAPAAEGFTCNSCGTAFKEKWGKCPKCGGTVERSKAPAEVSQMEARHQAIEGMELTPPAAPPTPSAPTPSSGSSMLDDLLGGGPPPPEEPPTPSGTSELPDLGAPPEAPTPSPAPAPGGGLESLTESSGSAEFKASQELPTTPGAEPGAGMEDLLGGLDLPDEEEPPTPEAAAEEGERELTPEDVGIRQAELSTDFSYAKPKRTVPTKKVRRKTAGTSGRPPPAKRPSKAKAGARPKAAPRQQSARRRPKPKAQAPPPTAGPPSNSLAPPPPEELKSDLLELIKQPSNHERKR